MKKYILKSGIQTCNGNLFHMKTFYNNPQRLKNDSINQKHDVYEIIESVQQKKLFPGTFS